MKRFILIRLLKTIRRIWKNRVTPPVSDVADRLPENVRLITLQLDVISPNFERSQKFLKELEKLERLVRVDSLSFSKPGEMELLEADETDIPINMSVTLTTFYYRQ